MKEMEVADMKSNLLFDNEIVKYFFLFYFVNQAVRAFMFEQWALQTSGFSRETSGFPQETSGFSLETSCFSRETSGFSQEISGISLETSGLS